MEQKLSLLKIKGAMAEAGINQIKLSELTNISQRTISLKLNGLTDFTVKELTLFAKILKKDVSYFFDKVN